MIQYDLAIIGGGPAGYTAAERAASQGLKVILFEKDSVGGICLHEGCIPTKTLLYSAKTLDNAKNAAKYGIISGEGLSFDLGKIIARKNKVVRKLTAGIKMKLAAHDVTIITGLAAISHEKEDLIFILCNGEKYQAHHLLLSTGSETIVPPIKGLSDIVYWTSKEALDSKELPQSIAIIGGGVIGIEFASFFNSMGVKVSVIEMMPEIINVVGKECAAMLRTEYAKKGIDFHLETKVIEVSQGTITLQKEDTVYTLEADRIMVSVGRKPLIEPLGLENLQIEVHQRGVSVNEYMQTSHPKVYACGDITGHWLLAHAAVREAEVAINHLLGKNDKMSYKAIPSVVYTNPEVASIGKTEEQLSAESTTFRVLKLPMAFSGRFVAENEMGNGICKLLIDADEHLVGCHMVGNLASELIVVAGIAIEKGYTVEEFQKIVFPHPTVSEIIHETLFA